MNHVIIFINLLLCLAFGCKGKEKTPKFDKQSAAYAAPNSATVKATLVALDSTLEKGAGNPCAIYPCYATMRIDEVVRINQATPHNIAKGKQLSVKFMFTLAPTDKATFPNMDADYPGVKINDLVECNLDVRPGIGDEINYYIYDYKIISHEN